MFLKSLLYIFSRCIHVLKVFKEDPYGEQVCQKLNNEFHTASPMKMNFLAYNKELERLSPAQKKRAWTELEDRVKLLEKQVSILNILSLQQRSTLLK